MIWCWKFVSDQTSWCVGCGPCRQVHVFFGELNKKRGLTQVLSRATQAGGQQFDTFSGCSNPEKSDSMMTISNLRILILRLMCINTTVFERGCVWDYFYHILHCKKWINHEGECVTVIVALILRGLLLDLCLPVSLYLLASNISSCHILFFYFNYQKGSIIIEWLWSPRLLTLVET